MFSVLKILTGPSFYTLWGEASPQREALLNVWSLLSSLYASLPCPTRCVCFRVGSVFSVKLPKPPKAGCLIKIVQHLWHRSCFKARNTYVLDRRIKLNSIPLAPVHHFREAAFLPRGSVPTQPCLLFPLWTLSLRFSGFLSHHELLGNLTFWPLE